MRLTRRLSVAAATGLALVVVATVGCSSLKGLSTKKASAKSTRDIAACEKMCTVAGDAENNKSAVDACKQDCRN